MTTNTNTPDFSTMTHAERLAYFSAANLDRAPIMPATISRPAPRPRRNSVRHRAIR